MPEASAAAAAPGPMAMLFPLAMMFLIFYVLVFRPQAKSRREHQQMLKELKKHDAVATTGGLIGTVVNLKPETVTLKVDENVRVEIERAAVTRVLKSKSQAPDAAPAATRA